MIILYGMYRFGRKRIAYRNDYCLTCEEPRAAEEHRTFDMGHLFFVPLLPLGHHNRWHCTVCNNDPHARVQSSRGLLIFFAGLLGLVSVGTWIDPFFPAPADAGMIWGMRMGFAVSFIALVFWLRKAPPMTNLAEKMAQVLPFSEVQCARCHQDLRPDGFCETCVMHHRPLHRGHLKIPLPPSAVPTERL